MRRCSIARPVCAVALLAACAASPSSVSAQASKPQTTVIDQHVHPLNPAATLEEQVTKADAVLRGTIVAATVKAKEAPRGEWMEALSVPFAGAPAVYTEFLVRVHEVLKQPRPGGGALGSGEATIVQLAGEYRWREYLIRANPGSPVPEVGKEYVLMVQRNETFDDYVVSVDGIYELGPTTVEARGAGPASRAQHGRTTDEFLGAVRQAAR